MKYLISLFAALSFAFSVQEDIKPLLCDKNWYISYYRSAEKFVSIPEAQNMSPDKFSIYFNSNGEFKNTIEGETKTGKWTYDEKTKEFTTIENKTTVLTLIRVVKDSLEFRGPEGAVIGFVTKR